MNIAWFSFHKWDLKCKSLNKHVFVLIFNILRGGSETFLNLDNGRCDYKHEQNQMYSLVFSKFRKSFNYNYFKTIKKEDRVVTFMNKIVIDLITCLFLMKYMWVLLFRFIVHLKTTLDSKPDFDKYLLAFKGILNLLLCRAALTRALFHDITIPTKNISINRLIFLSLLLKISSTT